MTIIEALAQADRHCDLEGLPPASQEARRLDIELAAERISAGVAVRQMLALHRLAAAED
ncbi:hypothetical protein JN531_013090 [Flagellatimonas centrodinii]|uniref:hypothetical protein n=1 Tax=Flagellatimonas centrodinii TaxID=2806210 RepID=UPI001FEFEF6F|nr:hypothetical protein [Flagellatimonas centrodinii]ULQ46032.1 hypothetical protein JN531_013090 [Flagellatimonas centrodinii]